MARLCLAVPRLCWHVHGAPLSGWPALVWPWRALAWACLGMAMARPGWAMARFWARFEKNR